MPYCRYCGREIGEDFDYCPECGRETNYLYEGAKEFPSVPTKKCRKCGAEMPVDMFYCLECGERLDYQDTPIIQYRYILPQEQGVWRNKWIALLLCLCFGWIGAHKYYESKVGLGILYTITCGLLGWGWIIDFFILLFKPNPYFVKK